MLTFALESLFGAIGNDALPPERAAFWETVALVAKSFLPCRLVNFQPDIFQGKLPRFSRSVAVACCRGFLVPVLSLAALYTPFVRLVTYDPPTDGWVLRLREPAKILNVLFLISTVLILTNIERTFRAAVGTMRWRIKFLFLGLGVIFGARIYTRSQALLFSDYSPSQLSVETTGSSYRMRVNRRCLRPEWIQRNRRLSVTCRFTHLGHGFAERGISFCCWRIGSNRRPLWRRSPVFRSQPLLSCLASLSWPCCCFLNGLEQSVQLFVSRHFKRPQHDFRQIWARFTQSLSASSG